MLKIENFLTCHSIVLKCTKKSVKREQILWVTKKDCITVRVWVGIQKSKLESCGDETTKILFTRKSRKSLYRWVRSLDTVMSLSLFFLSQGPQHPYTVLSGVSLLCTGVLYYGCN